MPQTKGTVLDKPSWYGPARPALVLELLWEAVLHEEGSEEQKGTEPPPRAPSAGLAACSGHAAQRPSSPSSCSEFWGRSVWRQELDSILVGPFQPGISCGSVIPGSPSHTEQGLRGAGGAASTSSQLPHARGLPFRGAEQHRSRSPSPR